MGGAKSATVTISPGVEMPTVAFGTFKLRGDACRDAVREALMVGFRAVDTASCYRNEDAVADALKSAPRNVRDETWITTKLAPDEMTSEEATNRAIDGMVARLGRAPDLLLVHWPGRSKAAPESDAHGEARKRTWRCMENALRNHKCRAIGTSNYEIAHMRELLSYCDVPPAVNQIEIHPAYPNTEVRAYCASLVPRVHTVGYSPLGVGELLDHPSVRAFADAIGLAPAPALIRWTLSNDCSVVVKSSSRAHTEENFTALSSTHTDDDTIAHHAAILERAFSSHHKKFCWDPRVVR
jgi:diketogulonate reductase-like aldo/keto reductase